MTGTIKSLDGGVLLVGTAYGGDIRVKFDQVKTLQSDTALVIRDTTLDNEYRAKLVRADEGLVTLNGVQQDGGTAQPVSRPVELSELERVTRPHFLLRDVAFKGKFDLSANRKSASTDAEDIAAAVEGEARHGLWRHQAGANYARSEDDDNVNTNNYGANYTLDRFLTEKAFWQGRASHKRDFVEELDRQTAYGTGPGYQFWDDELGAFSLSGLIGRVHYGYADSGSEAFYAASLRWNYVRYLRGKQFELYTRGEVSRPLGNNAEYAFNAEAGLRYNVTDWMALYVKYMRDRVSGSRENLNESTYGTGVGISW